MVSTWIQDLKLAVRQQGRSLGFTCAVVLTLALGIGANTAVFSLVYGILLAPLPFSQPDRVVVLREESATANNSLVSPVSYDDWLHRNNGVFEQLAAFRFWENRSLKLGNDGSVPVLHVTATPNFFPARGRVYGPENPGGVNEAVISHSLWTQSFGGNPDVIGKTIRVSGSPYLVVGVMPPVHKDLNIGLGDIWSPLHIYDVQQQRATSYGSRYMRIVGRLSQSVTLAQAQARRSLLQMQLAQEGTQ